MEVTPKRAAMAGFSSTLTLAITALPSCSTAMSSRTGPSMRHGPHHSAQKSTRTGSSDWRTFWSKSASVTVMVLMAASWGLFCV